MAVGNLERKLALLHLEAIHSRLFVYRDTKHMYTSICIMGVCLSIEIMTEVFFIAIKSTH